MGKCGDGCSEVSWGVEGGKENAEKGVGEMWREVWGCEEVWGEVCSESGGCGKVCREVGESVRGGCGEVKGEGVEGGVGECKGKCVEMSEDMGRGEGDEGKCWGRCGKVCWGVRERWGVWKSIGEGVGK